MTKAQQTALVNATLAACGMSPAGLATALGVHRRTVERWRTATVPMPGPAVAYCTALLHQRYGDNAQ